MADSSLAVDAAALLASRGVGTVGTNIFTGRLPSSPDSCLALDDKSGPTGEYTMGSAEADPLFEYLNLQVIARHTTYAGAWALACQVHNILRNFRGTMNGTVYALVRERYGPMSLERDENNRSMFALNYTAIRRP